MAPFDAINDGMDGSFSEAASNDNGGLKYTSAPTAIPFAQNLNPENKKVVFVVGKNAPAHYVLREAIETIADYGVHCDVYLTDVLPKSKDLKEKLARPETRNFGFFEKLMIDYGDAVLEKFDTDNGLQLNYLNELRSDLQYTPRQLAEYYSTKGVCININDMTDLSLPESDRSINDPSFIQKIDGDDDIVRGYNIRGMQILKKPLINAFENKVWKGLQGRILNAHPGDVIQFPGTNIAFWARMKNFAQNVWTLHVIDEGIDTGDFLDRTAKVLKNGKTLMQDMLGMSKNAAGMIVNDMTMFFNGSPRTPTPQNTNFKPKQNFTYATHQEWLDANKAGINGVEAGEYIKALVMDYTGSLTDERSVELHRALASATLDWQNNYVHNIYPAEYGAGAHPPEFDPKKPNDYFVEIPPPYIPPSTAHTPTHP